MDTKCRLLTKYQVQLTVDYDAHMGEVTFIVILACSVVWELFDLSVW